MPGEAHPSSLPDLLERAVARHEAGDLATATRLYLEILQREPRHFEALHRLGVARAQAGDAAAAVRHLTAAIAVNPQSAEAHVHLAHSRMAAGETEAALDLYDQALALRPDFPEALYSRGNALQALQRHAEAVESYDQALALAPDRLEILTNRGNALHDLKRLDEALADYDRALALRPDAAMLHNNRGNTLRELRRHAEALAEFDRALALDTGHFGARVNRGNVLQDLRHHREALAEFDRALALNPHSVMLHGLRAGALHDLNRYAEAVESYRRALQLDPANPETLYSYALTLRASNRHEDAADALERLLALAPEWNYAQGDLFHSRVHCCDWSDYAPRVQGLVRSVVEGRKADTPFSFLAVTASAAAQRGCAQTYAADKYPASKHPLWAGTHYAHDRIRVAYVSADFREHPVSRLMTGVFERHDRRRFEISGYSLRPDDGSMTSRRVKAALGNVVDVFGKSDGEIAVLMHDMQIDVAVDLTGHTLGGRPGVFAQRPAPVQVNYLGFPGTMGADFIDYILADRFVIPEEHHPHYTEKVVYLPDTFQANDSRRRIAERTPSRAEAGLPQDGFVFCSFNNTYKFTPGMFDIWMRLLGRVEGSVLWLQQINATAAKNLRREALARGIDASRLVFAPRLPRLEDHLARYRLADLFLDTLPYNAQTTASDALWAGLPVITCLGTTFVGRVAGSLLNAIGLPEMVTNTLEEYEALALELATNRGRLADIKSKLAQNRCTYPLFDTDRFRRHIEAAYTRMWERYQRSEPPASFAVQPIDK